MCITEYFKNDPKHQKLLWKGTSLRYIVWEIVICLAVDSLMIALALSERVSLCLYCYLLTYSMEQSPLLKS